MGKVKMSCHMQFSSHYIRRYFNVDTQSTRENERKKTNQFSKEASEQGKMLKNHRNFRAFIISPEFSDDFLSGMSELILFCWHVYCLRFSIFLVCLLDFLFERLSWTFSLVRPNAFHLMASLKHMIEYEIRRLWRKKNVFVTVNRERIAIEWW